MTVATKSSRTIQIDGMKGEDCCKKVNGALKSVSNIETHKVEVGSAKIEADHAGCTAACKAIDGAGFKAHADESKNDQPNGRNQDGPNKDSQKHEPMAGRHSGSKAEQSEIKVQPKGEQKSHAGGNAGSKPGAR